MRTDREARALLDQLSKNAENKFKEEYDKKFNDDKIVINNPYLFRTSVIHTLELSQYYGANYMHEIGDLEFAIKEFKEEFEKYKSKNTKEVRYILNQIRKERECEECGCFNDKFNGREILKVEKLDIKQLKGAVKTFYMDMVKKEFQKDIDEISGKKDKYRYPNCGYIKKFVEGRIDYELFLELNAGGTC